MGYIAMVSRAIARFLNGKWQLARLRKTDRGWF